MQTILLAKRTEKRISKTTMAKLLGISRQTYDAKERGLNCFTMDEMFVVANYFNATLGDIFLPRESTESELNE